MYEKAGSSSEESMPLTTGISELLRIPEANDTPVRVREFLAQLLSANRVFPNDSIQRIVEKWTLGSGQELRSYTPYMFFDIFGREEGWIIYKEVKVYIYREERKREVFSMCM